MSDFSENRKKARREREKKLFSFSQGGRDYKNTAAVKAIKLYGGLSVIKGAGKSAPESWIKNYGNAERAETGLQSCRAETEEKKD